MDALIFSFSALNCLLITYTRHIIKRSERCYSACPSLALSLECGMVVKLWQGVQTVVSTSALITSKGQVCMRG